MLELEIEIINKLGLHARAAAKLVACASGFKSAIDIEKSGRRVNAKSIMGVMMLAASQGSMVKLYIEGDDSEQAIEALRELINDYFGEGE